MPVSRAYEALANTLYKGLRDVGQSHIEREKLNLMGAKQEYEMSDPVELLNRATAEINLEKKTRPYGLSTISGGNLNAVENLTALADKNDPNTIVLDLFPRSLGFTEFKDGKYYRPGTNEYCNMLHVEAHKELFDGIIQSNFDLTRHHRGKIEELTQMLESEKDPNRIAQIQAELQASQKFLTDPREQIKSLTIQAQTLSTYGPLYKSKIAEIDKQIERLTKLVNIEPKTGEGQFTLGEGQVRYGPGGEVIAKGKEKVEKLELKKMINKAGVLTWHKLVDGNYVDTGLETQEVWQDRKKIEEEIRKELKESGKKDLKRTDIAALTTAYVTLMKAIEDGEDEEIKLRVNSINEMRKSLGLKPMEKKIIPGKKGWLWNTPEKETHVMDFGEGGELPKGLTEKDIEYNMNTYEKTREEVIKKYKERKGIK